jgi:isoleucyl-tRNA synthetase
MPFAQFGAPWRNEEEFARSYPAQFICEAIDQTRGWFYSLMAIGTLALGRSAYENVVCLGLIADERGRKMSKRHGNVLEPLPLMDTYGADAIRWFFAAAGSPWATRKIGAAVLEEIVRKVLLTYWNAVSFLVLYANATAAGGDAWTPGRLAEAPPVARRPVLDRWILSELHALVRDVTAALEAFDSAAAGRRMASFVDDLSNWYVRRSRRRFWPGPSTPDGAAAFATLYTCLQTLTRLMAPITPFITDYLWGILRAGAGPDSVHLASWPAAEVALIDDELGAQMALTRRVVELGRSARASAALRVRQPLARALVGLPGFTRLPAELRAQVCDELNIRVLEPLDAEGGEIVRHQVRPSFRALGPRFGQDTPAVAAAIEAADPADLAAQLRSAGAASVEVNGALVSLTADEVIVTQTPRAGWAVASDAGGIVALEVAITPELRREGYARGVVRLIQEARKKDGLDVSDRISLRWATTDRELEMALTEHHELISAEVLATDYGPAVVGGAGEVDGGSGHQHVVADLGLTFWIRKA